MSRQQKEERGTQCEIEDGEPKGSLKNRSHDDHALSQASTESKVKDSPRAHGCSRDIRLLVTSEQERRAQTAARL